MTEYGHRSIPSVIDQIARDEPERTCIAVPRTSEASDGWEDISFKRLANAINRITHLIIKDLGRSSTFETFAYIGPNDARYMILVIAAIKAGHQVLYISPRNSFEGQMNLFEKTNCKALYYAPSLKKTVAPWLSHRDMKGIPVAGQSEWLNADEVPHVPYTKTFEQWSNEPFAVLHTSGSTGLPKPIFVKQGAMAVGDHFHKVSDLDGRENWVKGLAQANRMFSPMPLFHAAGLYLLAMMTTYWKVPIVLGQPDRPLSVDAVHEVLEHSGADAAFLAPSILEEMSKSRESIDALKKLKYAVFGGGSLSTAAGNTLADAGVLLMNIIASTESSVLAAHVQRREDWSYFIFNDAESGLKWKKYEGTEDVYELFLVRKPDIPQGVFYTFPHLDEWSTSDLFRKHPTRPNQWQYYGRADNIIVFSNGEKLNPTTIEDYVQGHPSVVGSLVVGSKRFQPGLIIEPKQAISNPADIDALIDEIWPIVVKANKETVAHGQIGRQFIMVTQPGKPFPRAGKGSIQRGLAVKLYADEIDELYSRAGDFQPSLATKLDLTSQETLMLSIEEAIKETLGVASLEPDTDFFSAGFDSMKVLNMSRSLKAGLEAASGHAIDANTIATRVIYTNPTPRKLAASLYSQVVAGNAQSDEPWQVQDMEALYKKYAQDLPKGRDQPFKPATSCLTIILTGSTGSLGSYLLTDLINNSNVASIVCLNRAEDGRARQTETSTERGLSTDFTKVEFLQADLAKDQLGLSASAYSRLLRDADRIIHNQWQVNFNLSLASFEPFVRGTRHLIDFAASANKQPHITFASTIGTVEKWGVDHKGETVPEKPLAQLGLPHNGMDLAMGGYGQSKQVASMLLEEAAKQAIVSSAIVRVGQIGGPLAQKGQWNKQEWLPSILASSAYLGAMPESLGMMDTIDWTPSEPLAGFMLDLAGVHGHAPAPQGYYHAVNPHVTHWSNLVPTVRQYFGDRVKRQVPLREWLHLLVKSQSDTSDSVNQNPAYKLLDFLQNLELASAAGMVYMKMETCNSEAASPTMQRLEAVKSEWMENWLQQWAF